jgi:Flp pilus assembly pilin Flp
MGADERGATAIEYALICGLIFLAIVIGINNYVVNVKNMYNNISNNI